MAEHTAMTPIDLRYTSLFHLLRPQFRESIVIHVLEHKGALPNDVRRTLDSVINSVVKIQQFPKQPAIAPGSFLKRPLLDQLVHSERLANLVLQAWFATQEKLYAIVRSYLHGRDIEVAYPDFVRHRFQDTWPYNEWVSERNGLLAAYGSLNEDDVALMLCFAVDRIPDGFPVTFERQEVLVNDVLDQARHYLESLPADAPEWSSNVLEFLAAVTDIVDRKTAERHSVTAVRELNTVITDLRLHSDLLEYLELDLSSWKASPRFPLDEVVQLAKQLNEFNDLLEKYDPAPKIGNSLSDTQRLREEHDAASLRIQVLKRELDEALLESAEFEMRSSPPTPHDPVERIDPQISAGRGLSAIELSNGTLDLSPSQQYYTLDLDNQVESLAITPVMDQPDSSVVIAVEVPDGERTEGLESDNGTFIIASLPIGRTIISMNVIDENGTCSSTYRLAVTRAPTGLVSPVSSSDAGLKSLHLLGAVFEFPTGTTHLDIGPIETVNGLTVIPETSNGAASIVLDAALPNGSPIVNVKSESDGFKLTWDALHDGDLTLNIRVTAEDNETVQLYTAVVKGQTVHDFPSLLWSLVALDDLSGAYWVATFLVEQGLSPPVSPLLLKALQGGRWLSPDSDTYITELFDIVAEFQESDDTDVQTLLRISASLLPSLIAPETNLLAWLASPRCLPALESIISPIKAFASTGNSLRPEHISGNEGLQHIQSLIVDASNEARRWLAEAANYQTKFPWAVRVWQYLCRDGVLTQMLTPVSADRRDQLKDVEGYVNLLTRDGYIETINQAEHLMGGRPRKQGAIVGNARDWLIKRIEEGKDRATTWCRLVSREAAAQPGKLDSWQQDQVAKLRSQLQDECPNIFDALLELGAEPNPQDVRAAARCATRSLQQLTEYLNIDVRHEAPWVPSQLVSDLTTAHSVASLPSPPNDQVNHLETAISTRLLWVPSLELSDAMQPVSDDRLAQMAQTAPTSSSDGPSLIEVIQSRVDHRDFRFCDILMSSLPTEALDRTRAKYAAELNIERKTLREAIESTQTAVAQAEKDGVLEFEGSMWNKHQHALEDLDPDSILHFGPVYNNLQTLRQELHRERNQRGLELLEEWQILMERMISDIDVNDDFLTEVSSTFQIASSADSLDIRVMEDCVSRVRNHQSGEEASIASIIPDRDQIRSLEKFLTFSGTLRDPKAHSRDSNGLRNLVQELEIRV